MNKILSQTLLEQGSSINKSERAITQIYEGKKDIMMNNNPSSYYLPIKRNNLVHISNHEKDKFLSNQIWQENKNKAPRISVQATHVADISFSSLGGKSLDNSLQKVGLKQYLHHQTSASSQQLRIFKSGQIKRIRSDKEELQFFRLPYHEKKYLGNEIFPPEPMKIQQLSNSNSDLFTFKPNINHSNIQNQKNLKERKVMKEPPLQQQSMELEIIEYQCSPIAIKNNFKNNPGCLHSLANKTILKKITSAGNSPSNKMYIKVGDSQQNSKYFLDEESSYYQIGKQTYQKQMNVQQNYFIKPEIKSHNAKDYIIKGVNQIVYPQSRQQKINKLQSKQDAIQLPPFAKSLENMNHFSIAKSNLIKYANNLKL